MEKNEEAILSNQDQGTDRGRGLADQSIPRIHSETRKATTDQRDKLEVEDYAQVLTNFILKTNTPMTIGIQGEWGSGKTSLLNVIYDKIQESEPVPESGPEQIWINAWEHSLCSTPEKALFAIAEDICVELTKNIASDEKNKVLNAVKNLGRIAGRLVDQATKHKAGVDVKAAVEVDNNKSDIRVLREKLYELLTKTEKTRVIYIDDLDRLPPKDAVAILELLKNIFDLQYCVFVLAIDYQVVVKGLKEKFGSEKEDNEWEYRSFFDKIIQLPFHMPMGDYQIEPYVNECFEKINFKIRAEDKNQQAQVINHTTGSNPRTIKRLVNCLKLVRDLHVIKQRRLGITEAPEDETRNFLLFVLISIQIAYPVIYKWLTREPNFTKWNKDEFFDVEHIRLDKDEETYLENWKKKNDEQNQDSEWKMDLYYFCYGYREKRYKARYNDIVKVLDLVKNKYSDTSAMEMAITKALVATSLTEVTAADDSGVKKSKSRTPGADEFWSKIYKAVKGTGAQSIDKRFDYMAKLKETNTEQDILYLRSETVPKKIGQNFNLTYQRSKRSILEFQFPARKKDYTDLDRIIEYDKLKRHKASMDRVLMEECNDEMAKLHWTGFRERLRFENKGEAKNFSESIPKDGPDISSKLEEEKNWTTITVELQTPEMFKQIESCKEQYQPTKSFAEWCLNVAPQHPDIVDVKKKYKEADDDWKKSGLKPPLERVEIVDQFGACFAKFIDSFAHAIEHGIKLVERP